MKSAVEVVYVLLLLVELCTFSSFASGEHTLPPENLFHKINFDRLLVLLSEAGTFILGSAYNFALTSALAIITWVGAQLATQNGDANIVSLGRYDVSAGLNYEEIAIQNNYTYFHLPTWLYNTLNYLGLATPVNRQFMENQIELGKDFFVTGVPGIDSGLQMEMEMLQSPDAGYVQINTPWIPFTRVFQSPVISWH